MKIEISLYFGIPEAHGRIFNVYYTKFITVSYFYFILETTYFAFLFTNSLLIFSVNVINSRAL